MVLVVFTSLKLLGSSRLGSCIRTAAFQGVLLGFLPIVAHPGSLAPRLLFMAAAAIGLKGIVFPWLLFRALRGARVRREVGAVVGYTRSLPVGVLALLAPLWAARHPRGPGRPISPPPAPPALSPV